MIKQKGSVKIFNILKYNGLEKLKESDLIVSEEPLLIKLQFVVNNVWQENNLTITMRTPGNDFELALGFLYSESIINSIHDVLQLRYCINVKENEKGNVVVVKLSPEISIDFKKLNRHFFTNSSCGVCGKTAIESVCNELEANSLNKNSTKISQNVILKLNSLLKEKQSIFKHTGGIHAAALFDSQGNFKAISEDIGRHNALDKLIGQMVKENNIPLNEFILFLSGRISFELVQKAVRVGIQLIVAIGAPSSLAIELAEKNATTLIGFIKKDSYNVYSCPERILYS